MWDTNSIWFEIAIVSGTMALGHILFGHFEERTPRIGKLLKYIIVLALIIGLSVFFGRTVALTVFAICLLPALYIHMVVLPKNGINGWTGEPRSRYYDFRKWDKDIF